MFGDLYLLYLLSMISIALFLFLCGVMLICVKYTMIGQIPTQ